MKKVFLFCLMLTFIVFLFGCTDPEPTPTQQETLSQLSLDSAEKTFSYADVLDFYNSIKDDPGVHFDGFVNTDEVSIENEQQAFARAKTECKGEYPETSVRYDADAKMWEVCFSQGPNSAGGCLCVFMTHTGITTLIVAGE